MGKARELKRRADSMLEEVFRSLFEEIDTEKIRRDVAALKESAPDFHSDAHARLLVRRTALRCAAAGAVSGLPSGLIAIGTLGAELAFLVFQQFRLILGIATVYGHEPSQRERFAEAMSCLAYASGVGIGRQGIAAMLESATIDGGRIAEKIGTNFFRERLAKAIPFVGAVSGGALNYVSVRAVGRAAIKFYEAQIDAGIADEIWADGDREGA
jgi:hypothetical protein